MPIEKATMTMLALPEKSTRRQGPDAARGDGAEQREPGPAEHRQRDDRDQRPEHREQAEEDQDARR